MNRNQIELENQNELQQGEYVVRRSRRSTIIALCVCVLLALVVWVAVMNAQDTDQIAIELLATSNEYSYTLSDAHIEVEGTVAVLRHVKVIEISVSDYDEPGVYTLTEDQLELPEGVSLTKPLTLTITVAEK